MNSDGSGYMNTAEDWLTKFNIRLPKNYLSRRQTGESASQEEEVLLSPLMEQTISFDNARHQRRPLLFRSVKSEQQVFGPNIAFKLVRNVKGGFPSLVTKSLRGSGTVEKSLAAAVNGSAMVDSLSHQDLEVNLVASQPFSKLSQAIELLAKNLEQFKQEKVEDNSSENDIVKLSFKLNRLRLSLWVGFKDPLNVLHLLNNSTR